MGDILVIGHGPLPRAGAVVVGSAGWRTDQVVRALNASPHSIHLYALPDRHRRAGIDAAEKKEVARLSHEGLAYQSIESSDWAFALGVLGKAVETIRPSCIVASGLHAACLASQLRTRLPLWVDLGGFPSAEAQINARRCGNEAALEQAWKEMHDALLRADKFSVGSMPQLYALLGQLGSVGRLNRLTAQYHFAHHSPPAFHPMFAGSREGEPARERLRRRELPSEAFAVLWSGAFDSGSDIDCLFTGLEKAMAANPLVHFVATGGQDDGRDELTHRRFRLLTEKSPFALRYHMLGWVETERLPSLYGECNLGLCAEGRHYDTLFSSRFRPVNMMAAGLPVVSTLGSETSHILNEEGIGLTYPAGDSGELANHILRCAAEPHAAQTMGQEARGYVTSHFAADSLMQALLEWIDDPRLAPDNAEKDRTAPSDAAFQEYPIDAVQRTQLRLAGHDLEDLFQAKIDIDIIRSKWWYRLGRMVKRRALAFLRSRRIIR